MGHNHFMVILWENKDTWLRGLPYTVYCVKKYCCLYNGSRLTFNKWTMRFYIFLIICNIKPNLKNGNVPQKFSIHAENHKITSFNFHFIHKFTNNIRWFQKYKQYIPACMGGIHTINTHPGKTASNGVISC